MGLVFGSTDLRIIFRSQAGTWLHPSIPPWLTHSHSSSQTPTDSSIYPFYLTSLQGSHIYLPSCPSSMHSHAPSSCPAIYPTTYPLVYPFTKHIFLQPPSHTTCHPSILSLLTSLCKSTSTYILFSPLSVHTHTSVHTCTYTWSIRPSIHHLRIHPSFYPSSHPPTHGPLLSCSHLYPYQCEC